MSDWLMKVIKAEAERLIKLAAEDDELRADLRALAESILTATASAQPEATPAPEAGLVQQAADAAVPTDIVPADSPRVAEPLRELTLGRSPPSKSDSRPVSAGAARLNTSHDDLMELETRCRWKAEAARYAAEHLRQIGDGNGFQVEDSQMAPEMVKWAGRLTDCFYWLSSSAEAQTADLSLLDTVAGCFDTVAEALALVRAMLEEHTGNPKVLERSLPLVAEAQSALRAALQRLGAGDDPDQTEVFEWLKLTAARRHVYIKRFMRADDFAEPGGWHELLTRIESIEWGGPRSRHHHSLINHVRDHVMRLQEANADDDGWVALINAVDEVVAAGVPPSNRELRELLLPVIDDLPERDELPSGFRLVLREIDRFQATRSVPTRSSVAHEPSAEAKDAARLLNGKCVVLIGGNRRREAQEALRRALDLKDLVWIETKEHQAVDAFEPLIARPDVALVLLAIRWSSHAFGDVKQICDRHGKPLVRLPGGYNPNQVAAQVLSQSSAQLS